MFLNLNATISLQNHICQIELLDSNQPQENLEEVRQPFFTACESTSGWKGTFSNAYFGVCPLPKMNLTLINKTMLII